MYYWPKEDPQYDPNKSRVENYQYLRGLFENDLKEGMIEFSDGIDKEWLMNVVKHILNNREYKGAHLDWNYTEMLRDLIDRGLVKVPISNFDIVFVEWSSGNLNDIKSSAKLDKALYDWDGKEWPGCYNIDKDGWTHWWNKRNDLVKEHKYTDSNREEYIPTPIMNVPINQVEPQQYLNGADALQAMAQSQQQPVQVQYGGNQYIVPAQQQRKSWIPNVDYVDPNFIPEWERELMMKEAMMGAQGRALMKQMGLIPQYQPPQFQTVQPLPQQPLRFTSPEQVINYMLATQPEFFCDGITNDSIDNALEGTFIGVDDQ